METLALPDGRIIEYTVTGPADGIPLLSHHATPSSAVQLRAFQPTTRQRSA